LSLIVLKVLVTGNTFRIPIKFYSGGQALKVPFFQNHIFRAVMLTGVEQCGVTPAVSATVVWEKSLIQWKGLLLKTEPIPAKPECL
jgi:hypothetical protein